MKVSVQDLFSEYERLEKFPTKEDIRKAVKVLKSKGKAEINSISEDAFENVFDEFVRQNGRLNNWTTATFTKFSAVKKHLLGFKQNLSFKDLDEEGMSDYIYYLQKDKEMKNSTVKKQLGFLKWFLRWSFEKNYHNNDSFKSFRPKIKDSSKPVIFLTEEEKAEIFNYKIPSSKQYLEKTRDLLKFLCYTGLRYSDATI